MAGPWEKYAQAEPAAPEAIGGVDSGPWAKYSAPEPDAVATPLPQRNDPWAQTAQAIPVEEEEQPGYIGNALRQMGESASGIFGNLMGLADQAASNVEEWSDANLGGSMVNVTPEGKIEWLTQEEFAQRELAGETTRLDVAKPAERKYKELNLGARRDLGLDDVKEMAATGDVLGTLGVAGQLGVQMIPDSIPHMAAVMATAPAYFFSLIEDVAQSRAENNDRAGKPTNDDYAVAVPGAMASMLLERIGTEKLLGIGKAHGSIAKGIAAGALSEGTTEVLQGEAEYLTSTLGTKSGVKIGEALDVALEGLIGGGTLGTIGGGSAAAAGKLVGKPPQEEQTDLDAAGAAVNQEVVQPERAIDIEDEIEGEPDDVELTAPAARARDAVIAAYKSGNEAEIGDLMAVAEAELPAREFNAAMAQADDTIIKLRSADRKARKAAKKAKKKAKKAAQQAIAEPEQASLEPAAAAAGVAEAVPTAEPAPAPEPAPVEQADVAAVEAIDTTPADAWASGEAERAMGGVSTTPPAGPPTVPSQPTVVPPNAPQVAAAQQAEAEAARPEPHADTTPTLSEVSEGWQAMRQAYDDTRTEKTGGRPRTASSLPDADSAAVMLINKMEQLVEEGYDTTELRAVLKKAMGNRVPGQAVVNERGGQVISGRVKAGNVVGTGGQSKAAPPNSGGWGNILKQFFDGVDTAMADMLEKGPVLREQVEAKKAKKKGKKKESTPPTAGVNDTTTKADGETAGAAQAEFEQAMRREATEDEAAEIQKQYAPSEEEAAEIEAHNKALAEQREGNREANAPKRKEMSDAEALAIAQEVEAAAAARAAQAEAEAEGAAVEAQEAAENAVKVRKRRKITVPPAAEAAIETSKQRTAGKLGVKKQPSQGELGVGKPVVRKKVRRVTADPIAKAEERLDKREQQEAEADAKKAQPSPISDRPLTLSEQRRANLERRARAAREQEEATSTGYLDESDPLAGLIEDEDSLADVTADFVNGYWRPEGEVAAVKKQRGRAGMWMTGVFENGKADTDSLTQMLGQTLHKDDPYRKLLFYLGRKGIGNVPVRIVSQRQMQHARGASADGNRARGLYTFRGGFGGVHREILLHQDLFRDMSDTKAAGTVKTLLHEMVHAATVQALVSDNMTARRMEAIRKQVIRQLQKAGDTRLIKSYGLTNVDEFVAEALTNPDFQFLLANVRTDSGESMMRRFLNSIGRMLGLSDVDANSALAEVVALAPDLFQDEATIVDSMRYQRASGKRISVLESRASRAQMESANTLASIFNDVDDRAEFVREVTDRLSQTEPNTRKAALGLSTMDQIVRNHQGRLPTLRDYFDVTRKKTSIARAHQRTAERLNDRWRAYETGKGGRDRSRKLASVMQQATLRGMHVDKPMSHPLNKHLTGKQQGAFNALRREYLTLPNEGKGIYREAQEFFRTQRAEMRKTTLVHLAKSGRLAKRLAPSELRQFMNATKVDDIDALTSIDDSTRRSAETILSLTELKGPYFPLRRFGKYVTEGERVTKRGPYAGRRQAESARRALMNSDPTWKVKIEPDHSLTITERTVEMHETRAAAQRRATELSGKGYVNRKGMAVNVTGKEEWNAPPDTGVNVLIAQAKRKFTEGSAPARALDQAFLELLLENSMRKSELSRKNVAGASMDMRRGFAERAYAGSWAQADVATAFDHQQALIKMKGEARNGGVDAVRMHEVVQEVEARDNRALDERKVSGFDRAISRAGFLWYLASPSYSAINMTQPALVATPYLMGKYGPAGAAQLMRSYQGVAMAAGRELARIKAGLGGQKPTDLFETVRDNSGMTDGEKAMVDELSNLGVIDSTYAQDLYESSRGETPGGVTNWALNAARTLPQGVEVVNRITVARAAYNLELQRGSDAQTATRAAEEAVLQTQFDYSDQNKPRYFKIVPGARAVMMFKMYAQGMYALYAANILKVARANGNTKEGITTLAGLLATHSLAAGAVGGLLLEPLKIVEMIMEWFNEDEEEVNFERATQQWLVDMLGNEWGDVAARGLPRAFGIDLSSRVGLNNVLMMGGQDSRSYQDAFINGVISLGGPILAIGANAFKALDHAREGELARAFEAASPKFVRDILKAHRFTTSGMVDFRGNTFKAAEDMTFADGLTQAFGVTPAKVSRAYEGRGAQKSAETRLRDTRSRYMRAWRKAPTAADKAAIVQNEIIPFNRRNPEFAITAKGLIRSVTEQAKTEALTRAGAYSRYKQIRDIGERYAEP